MDNKGVRKMIKVKVEFLKSYRDQIESLSNELLSLRDKYIVSIDEEEITATIEAIEHLKIILETTPIA